MNSSILNTDIQHFINKNLHSNSYEILLKGTTFDSVSTKELIQQIEAKVKCEKKLPTWFNTPYIYYPNKLNIEQTSSEITATYKASLIHGKTIIDVTGGFGVDCYYFAKQFDSVTHCEIDKNLSELVNHNYQQLQVSNIKTVNSDGLSYLEKIDNTFDWIYVDPSRRNGSKGKVFFLNDCLPNIPEHLDLLFNRSKNIMIKTSPLLDMSVGIGELHHVKTIHVIAVNNEVKELLWILEHGFTDDIVIKTINLKQGNDDYFEFQLKDEKSLEFTYSKPLTYLYEPNTAILKAGAFNAVSDQLSVYKLHKHSHLYTSELLINFPGRCFKIENIIPYNKKELKQLAITKANITTRNFPETVEQIRKKLNIKDGGDVYLFFTTDVNGNKIVIVCSKI
ncbi:class I SAM-dependent methyltransferase [Confluentibacter flavum]|uniref:SAM-dependent methyltransferase n=1 Tax=Confluentibacter flavum TaxID=1909700 RepID=A0A2N3HMP1_9FLAO|nr:class I SAM-dependent methyltransferase [Confluentibacter flavum]PKQ46154.1 SAM-dependent methyltransferase [Confluentibacter flavum]